MTGKIVIVTGASSGIGKAAAALFARNRATVIAVGRNEKELIALQAGLGSKREYVKMHLADVTEYSQIDRMVYETVQTFGQIDVLVNAAGIVKSGTIENTTLDEWDKMMNVNLRSVFYLMQKCIPSMIESKGNIVNVSSVAARGRRRRLEQRLPGGIHLLGRALFRIDQHNLLRKVLYKLPSFIGKT